MAAKPRPAPAGGRSALSATTPALTRDARQLASLGVSDPIPIRTMPRTPIAALVKRLVAEGVVPAPTLPTEGV